MNSLLQSTSFVDSIWAVTKMHLFSERTEWVFKKCMSAEGLLGQTSLVHLTWAVTKLYLFAYYFIQLSF